MPSNNRSNISRQNDFIRILRGLQANEFDKYQLSLRERQVAQRILDGESVAGIAESLFLSESCIRYHITHIYRKLNVSSRYEFNRKIRTGIERFTCAR